jgi:hypothetical protein
VPAAATDLPQLFGFAQFDFAGTLAVADGRYLARDDGGTQSVLVVATLSAPAPARRRRRRPRESEPHAPAELPLARATAIRASEPFADAAEAGAWLEASTSTEEAVDSVVEEGIALLNRGLHAQAVASGDPAGQIVLPERAATVRIGFGDGEEVAAGRFAEAREVDVSVGASRRRRRVEELRPQERVAAVLGGRESLDACETLLLRARADLDAGRDREAALQLRAGLEALLVEMRDAIADPGHTADMAELSERRPEAEAVAAASLGGVGPSAEQVERIGELLAIGERVLRRRRVLRGG